MNSFTSHPKLGESLSLEPLHDGRVWRVFLDQPKANILDARMIEGLDALFTCARDERHLKLITIEGRGDHFCFGASVEEHQADQVAAMLNGFHNLFRAIAACGVPVVVGVRGQCLGGGLELAAFCHRIFAHPDACFGQPEVALGVFAPVGSAILADRVGRGGADDLLLTGRIVKAKEALAMGLIDKVRDTPEVAAMNWAEKHLLPRSASSLRFVTRAARLSFMRRFEQDIAELERGYVEELMKTEDANEGIASFIEKRKPSWAPE